MQPSRFRLVLVGLAWAAAWLLASCSSTPPSAPAVPRYTGPVTYPEWRVVNEGRVSAFEAYLRLEGLDEMVPMSKLLRTATSWRECNAAPFEVPPEAQWRDVVDVLVLLRDLRDLGILGEFEVHSTYRNPAVNACVGGASRSAHTRAFAVDFTPRSPANALDLICSYWRDQGRDRRMGLGRYPTGRLHVDTSGYRSWGPDGTARTAMCTDPLVRYAY